MLGNSKILNFFTLTCLFFLASTCNAQSTFEGVGIVSKVNKIAKIIIVDGQRIIIDGNIQVTVNNTQHHLLNILKEGSLLTVSGIKDNTNNFIATSVYIHHSPQNK